MTTFYSDHYTDEAPNGTVLGVVAKPRVKAPPGSGSAMKVKYTVVDFSQALPASGDYVRLFSFKSGDRVRKITVSIDDLTPISGSPVNAWQVDAMTARFGIWQAGANHDGVVIDDNVFSLGYNTLDLAAGNVQDEAVMIVQQTPGEGYATHGIVPLWSYLEQYGGTGVTRYTEDPHEDWDIVMKFHAVTTITKGGALLVIADYIPAGGG